MSVMTTKACWKFTFGFLLLVLLSTTNKGQSSTAPTGEITFTKNIAPILQRSCQNCHRPDGVAPMPLVTYEEVRPWAREIKQRTLMGPDAGVMPPWYLEKDIGIQKFQNDFSLSDQEIASISKWVDSGSPRGNPADMPPPRQFADNRVWSIGTPDLIVKTQEILVKANAPDWWGEIPSIPTGLTEDRYVTALEVKEINDVDPHAQNSRSTVGGRFVFHHMIWRTQVLNGKEVESPDPLTGVVGPDITNWPVHEVGRTPDFFDPKSARLLKAGSSVVSDSVHLHANGRDTKAHLEIGFKLMPKDYQPTYKRAVFGLGNGVDIDIRAMEANQQLHAYTVLQQHTKIISFEPHLHAPGSDLGIHHPDAQLRGLRPQLGAGVRLRRRLGAAPAEGDHPPYRRLHGQLAVEQERARPAQLAGVGESLGREHVHRPGHAGRVDR